MNTNKSLTDVLKATIVASQLPLLTLQNETGVQRASIMRFLRGETSLRLDAADKLAAYFELELVSGNRQAARQHKGK